ncbi:MAG: GspE/PulE family protein [Patescibacteria group bacterium]|nr:GspE/PulE family protein [Patescibacteria group bacterium]
MALKKDVKNKGIEGDNELLDILLKEKKIKRTQYEEIKKEAKEKNTTPEKLLEDKKIVREDDLSKAKSKVYNLPYIDLFGRMVRADVLNIIPQELAQNYKVVAFNKSGQEVSLAMTDPSNYKALQAIEFLARKNNFKIKYYLTSISSLKYVLRQYESLSTEVEEALKGAEAESRPKEEISLAEGREDLEEVVKTAPVSKMVSVIMRHAVEGKASDVHIEPVGNETRVRYRIDGVLHTSLVLPKRVHSSLIARIKVVSNLKIDETRVPQDGRFRMTIEERNIDYRVSTLPLIDAEKVVMRILDTASATLDLEDLGFWGQSLDIMKKNIDKSHGMFLITGPTGSGKSTTLYALLSILNEESVNIITLEDPVEYYMQGINQSQINTEVGLTFAAGLRSILRQDPDIIMVGEVRDTETAELAVHAALTGHIVLSTLHTNDAIGAIPRLIDMKIEPFLLTSSVNLVMAQRLVRKICPHCKEEFKLPEILEKQAWEELEKIDKEHLPDNIKLTKPLKMYRGKGCARCDNTGYKGRIAICEVMEINAKMKEVILSSGDIQEKTLEEFLNQGNFLMRQDGIIKALHGKTTIEEVWDATRA